MDFVEAIRAVKEGQRISREAWNDRDAYCCLHMGRLVIRMGDGNYHSWLIGEVDVYAHDWMTITSA